METIITITHKSIRLPKYTDEQKYLTNGPKRNFLIIYKIRKVSEYRLEFGYVQSFAGPVLKEL